MQVCRHFSCNNSGKSSFAKPWRTSEQQMVSRLTSTSCGFKHDAEVFLEFTLTNKVRQRPWA
jgi:hypothetical protein